MFAYIIRPVVFLSKVCKCKPVTSGVTSFCSPYFVVQKLKSLKTTVLYKRTATLMEIFVNKVLKNYMKL